MSLVAKSELYLTISDVDTVQLPSSLAFLIGIGIKRATLTLETKDGKWSMSEFTICAGSTTSLQLWHELSLDQVTLFVSRSKNGQKKVEFDAMLTLNKNFDFLTFSLLYDGPTSSGSGSSSSTVATADTPTGAVWSAMATYQGRLSVLDTLSEMSGLQLRDIIDQVDLPSLKDFLDIYITKLQIALTHSSDKSAFSFDADLEWLCFSHLRFACSKTSVWAYSFGFAIGSADDNLIKDIPILGPIIGAQVDLEHMSVVIYNYELDAGALDPLLKIPLTSSGGSISLAIAARLQFKGVVEDLTKVVGVSSMDIVGAVSSSAVTLSAAIGTPITLFNGSMTLAGAIMVQCKKENQMLPQIGVQGALSVMLSPQLELKNHCHKALRNSTSDGISLKVPSIYLSGCSSTLPTVAWDSSLHSTNGMASLVSPVSTSMMSSSPQSSRPNSSLFLHRSPSKGPYRLA